LCLFDLTDQYGRKFKVVDEDKKSSLKLALVKGILRFKLDLNY